MDEYYGMKIKFMTRGGSIHGILKGLDEDKELFMIEIGEEEFKLDVNEVVDMEPEECGIEEDGCKDSTVEDSKENMIKEGSKVDTLEDSKVDLKEERPKVNPFKNEGFKKDDNPPIEKDVALKDNLPKDKGISEEDNIPKDTPPTLTIPLKDTPLPPTHTVPLKDTLLPTFSTPIPLFHYNSLLSLSFSRFGPTKEEFISISSLNLFKLLKSYFSFNSKIDIILGEDPLYNSIGLTLGRLLLNNDYDIRVVGSPRNLEIVNYHYLYRENKGITLKKEREDNEFVIDLKKRSNVEGSKDGSKDSSKEDNIINKDIKKVIFTFGLIPNNTNHIFIHIALGLGILEFVKDLKEYFLIDGMINEGIYKKFGRTRKGMKSINRIRV